MILPVSKSKNGTPLYECACPDCGIVKLKDKRKVGTRCHACAMKARSTHGLSSDRLYKLLKNIEARCRYPSATGYKYYGGRGIKVAQEWLDDPSSFVKWAIANGYEAGLEIDRIDVNGDYEPENCRFVTHKENSQLRRNARCSLEKAAKIHDMIAAGESIKDIAIKVEVPCLVVWHIKQGNTWRINSELFQHHC